MDNSPAHLSLLIRTCRGCGEPFETADGRRTTCSDVCAAKRWARVRQAQHRAAHPDRERCRQILKNAINRGFVRRASRCEECGAVCKTEGHHFDYAKPFFVAWLCRDCHTRLEDGQPP